MKYLFFFSSFLSITSLLGQADCTVQISGGSFQDGTFIGNETVTINNEYTFPVEDLKKILAEIEDFEKIREDAVLAKAEAEERIIAAQKAEENTESIKKELAKERKRLDINTQNLAKNKQDFKNEIDELIKAFEARIIQKEQAINSSNTTDADLQEKIEALEEEAKALIASTKCMANDHEVYAVIDEEGKTTYGFSIQDLKSDPNYLIIEEPVNGISLVKKFNVYGFMNTKGEVLIEFQYDFAFSFIEGKALVRKHNVWQIIDEQGEVYKKLPEYGEIKPLGNKNFTVSLKKEVWGFVRWRVIDYKGNSLSPLLENISYLDNRRLIKIEDKGANQGLMDYDGKVIIPKTYSNISEVNENDLCIVRARSKEKWKVGVYHLTKGLILTKKYGTFFLSSKNLIWYHNSVAKNENKKYVLYDANAKYLGSFAEYKDFNKYGFARVRVDEYWGLIDAKGKVRIEPTINDLRVVADDYLLSTVKEKNTPSLYGLINTKNGKQILSPEYRKIYFFPKYDFIIAKEKVKAGKDEFGIYNLLGQRKSSLLLKAYSGSFEVEEKENYFILKTSNKKPLLAFMDKKSLVLYHRWLFYEYHFFPNGFTAYNVHEEYPGSWYLEKTNSPNRQVIIGPAAAIKYLEDGFFAVAKSGNRKYGVFTESGEKLVDYKYDAIKKTRSAVFIVALSDKRGVVNKYGAEIVPCIFSFIEFEDSSTLLAKDDQGGIFKINIKGDCISNCEQYKEILRKYYAKD